MVGKKPETTTGTGKKEEGEHREKKTGTQMQV